MNCHNYSYEQLEEMAEDLNKRYAPDRLKHPMKVDVYDIVDMLCLKWKSQKNYVKINKDL